MVNDLGTQDAAFTTIELHGESSQVVYEMLRYCYTFDYRNTSGFEDANFHATMCAAASKYEVQNLDILAATKFAKAAKDAPQESLACTIEAVYTDTSGLSHIVREKVVEVVLQRIEKENLLEEENAAFARLLNELPLFAADVLRAMVEVGA